MILLELEKCKFTVNSIIICGIEKTPHKENLGANPHFPFSIIVKLSLKIIFGPHRLKQIISKHLL